MGSDKQTNPKPSNNLLRGIAFGALAVVLCVAALWQNGFLAVPALKTTLPATPKVEQPLQEEATPLPQPLAEEAPLNLAPLTKQILAINTVVDGLNQTLGQRLNALEASLTTLTPAPNKPQKTPLEEALAEIEKSASLMVLKKAYFKGEDITQHLQRLAVAQPSLAPAVEVLTNTPAVSKRQLISLVQPSSPAPTAVQPAQQNLSWWQALLQKFVTIRQIPKAEEGELKQLIRHQKWQEVVEKTENKSLKEALATRAQQQKAWQTIISALGGNS